MSRPHRIAIPHHCSHPPKLPKVLPVDWENQTVHSFTGLGDFPHRFVWGNSQILGRNWETKHGMIFLHFQHHNRCYVLGTRVSHTACRFRLFRSELQRASTVPAPQASKVGGFQSNWSSKGPELGFWSLGRCKVEICDCVIHTRSKGFKSF